METLARPHALPLAVARPAGESLEARLLAARRLAESLGATAQDTSSLEDAVRELSPPPSSTAVRAEHFVLSPMRSPWSDWIDVLVSAHRPGASIHEATARSVTADLSRATLAASSLGLEGGVVDLASKRIELGQGGSRSSEWDVASCVLPYPGLESSGDALLVQTRAREGSLRLSVVDALGHGEAAARSASGLIEHIIRSPSVGIDQLVTSAHARRAAAPRGAALAVLDLEPGGTGRFAGVGNVDAVALGGATRPVSRSGTVGVALSHLAVDAVSVPPGGALVLATDGFAVRWPPFTLDALAPLDARLVLCALLATAQRRTDDATALVVRRAGGAR